MADKTLGMLVPATDIFPTDLFLVEQSGVAKNVPGQVMINFLVRVADGHGGVSDFQKLSESGLEKTYQFLMADGTKYQFTVTDGNSIADFEESVSGLVHTCKFIMDDGTEYSFTVSDGKKGDKGDNAYVHIRFASQKPTSSSSSMGTEPDTWIGFYSGNKAVAPTDPMEYIWAPFKGDKGNTGDPATLVTNKTEYQVSDSGKIVPSGVWSTEIPSVPPGKYLWARTTTQFNTGTPNYAYSISRFGIDGSGSVVTVNNVSPDENGNVELTAEQLQCLGLAGGTMTGPINMNGHAITGLNDPVEETDAVRKAYVDKSAREAAPVNILDNSDFRNPVNQRNKPSYNGSFVYTIDRWVALGTVSVGKGVTLSSGAYFLQRLENMQDQEYTGVVKIGDSVYSGTTHFDLGNEEPQELIQNSEVVVYLQKVGDNLYQFTMNSVKEVTVDWAALYEGAYATNTVPDYRPNGYVAELTECMRYFQVIYNGVARTAGELNACQLFVSLPIPMRISPTATLADGGLVLTGSGNPSVSNIQYIVLNKEHNYQSGFLMVTVEGTPASWFEGFSWVNGIIHLSADF